MDKSATLLLKSWNDVIHSHSAESESFTWYSGLNEDVVSVLPLLKKEKVKSILDVGCGDGTNVIPLVKKGFFVTGIDISPKGLNACKKTLEKNRLNKCVLVKGNMVDMPFIDNFFDFVLSTFAIGEMLLFPGVKKGDAVKSIKEIYRVLKKDHYCLLQLTEKVVKEYKTKNVVDKILKKAGWINIMKTIGFKIIKVTRNSFKDPPHPGATHGYDKPHTHYWINVLAKK